MKDKKKINYILILIGNMSEEFSNSYFIYYYKNGETYKLDEKVKEFTNKKDKNQHFYLGLRKKKSI